jgi:hypothetical protein
MINRKSSIIIILSVVIVFCFFLINCDELEELITTVSGKVYADNCQVVLAVKGETDLFDYLDDISEIDDASLQGETELFRGFDLFIGDDSLYNVTMLSFGETYFLAIIDDGDIASELDSADHVGFYGPTDTINMVIDTFIYSIPECVNIEEGIDETDFDIINFIEYRWFIRIHRFTNP